jgi:alpha-1,2-mannosyltransferase
MAAAKAWHPGNLSAFRFGFNALRFSYPPFALLVLRVIEVLPSSFCEHAWLIVSVLAALTSAWLGARMMRTPTESTSVAVVFAAIVVWSTPVVLTARLGQVNTFLALAVIVDLCAIRRGSRYGGVLTGLAAAIKLTPVFALAGLFALGRRRAALRGFTTAALATAAAALISPADSWHFWFRDLYDTSRIGSFADARNQSITGLLSRTFGNTNTVHLVALTAGALLIAVVLWHVASRRSDDMTAIALVMSAGSLVVPVSWVHHLLFGVFLVAALARVRPIRLGTAGPAVALALLLFVADDATAWVSSARTLALLATVLAVVQVSRYPLANSEVPNANAAKLMPTTDRRRRGRGSIALPTSANTGNAQSK